jgi:WD40 repeat protein
MGADEEKQTLKGHTGQVWQAAYSPDGKLLATAGEDEAATAP